MFLKEIRLKGFKSFADDTKLHLSPGITAVVGPNGCGKSNVADAIRWVLGEKSPKSLRAGKMQDVIFQGTDKRKPTNLCEVSLLFSDCEEMLRTAAKEIEVTRRVMRDGSNTYYLNRKACRLRDIQQLFMDTGVGQVSYSFMVQGQIDQILSSNPAERRVIFEEAAGVTRYKAQRKEALSKLERTQANLDRVADVIKERERQIGSLRRQAAKAMRYQMIRRRLTHVELARAAFRHSELEAQVSAEESATRQANRRLEELETALAGRRRNQEHLRSLRSDASALIEEQQQKVFELRREIDKAEEQAKFNRTRREDLMERAEKLRREVEELRVQNEEIDEQLGREGKTRESHSALVSSKDEQYRERDAALNEARNRLNEAEQKQRKARQDLNQEEVRASGLRREVRRKRESLGDYQIRRSGFESEVKRLEAEHAELHETLGKARTALQEASAKREAEEGVIAGLVEMRKSAEEDRRNLSTEISSLEKTVAKSTAEINVLEGLQQKLEGFGEGVKALMQGKLSDVAKPEQLRLLTKELIVEPAYTGAFMGLAGSAMDAVIVGGREEVSTLSRRLTEEKLGRACLQVEEPGAHASQAPTDLPDWLKPASEAVEVADKNLSDLVGSFLRGCYFSDSLEQFLDYWEATPDFQFLLVATKEGEVVDSRGLIYCGKGKGKPVSYLDRQNRIRELIKERGATAAELERQTQLRDERREEADRIEGQIEERRAALSELRHEVSTLSEQERSANGAIKRNESGAERARRDLENLERQNADIVSALEKLEKDLEASEEKLLSDRSEIEQGERGLETLRRETEDRREALAEVRLELAEKRQRLEVLSRNLDELSRRGKEIERTLERRAEEISNLEHQAVDLEEAADEAEERAGERKDELAGAEETLSTARGDLENINGKLAELEKSMAAELEEQRRRQDSRNKAEVDLAKLRSRQEHIEEEIRREYEREVSEINWRLEMWRAGDKLPERLHVAIEDDGEEGRPVAVSKAEGNSADRTPTADELEEAEKVDWAEIEEEAKQLRGRLNSMGPVSLDAIEEYAELKESYEFLKSQSEDLTTSRDELLSAIDDINQRSTELFRETFEQIRKNFHFTFDRLFGGGAADLALEESEDPLESGIEITARPPGTRLRSLQLLSGGQKTMTAVALLFAIYKVKPSPFCLLDELDAPLDESNVQRFTDIVKSFTEHSQFIIITHNKRTIASADTIFGVTMPDRGVSRLASLRFDRLRGVDGQAAAAI